MAAVFFVCLFEMQLKTPVRAGLAGGSHGGYETAHRVVKEVVCAFRQAGDSLPLTDLGVTNGVTL